MYYSLLPNEVGPSPQRVEWLGQSEPGEKAILSFRERDGHALLEVFRLLDQDCSCKDHDSHCKQQHCRENIRCHAHVRPLPHLRRDQPDRFPVRASSGPRGLSQNGHTLPPYRELSMMADPYHFLSNGLTVQAVQTGPYSAGQCSVEEHIDFAGTAALSTLVSNYHKSARFGTAACFASNYLVVSLLAS